MPRIFLGVGERERQGIRSIGRRRPAGRFNAAAAPFWPRRFFAPRHIRRWPASPCAGRSQKCQCPPRRSPPSPRRASPMMMAGLQILGEAQSFNCANCPVDNFAQHFTERPGRFLARQRECGQVAGQTEIVPCAKVSGKWSRQLDDTVACAAQRWVNAKNDFLSERATCRLRFASARRE